ncbi:hypothetical protein [Sphingobium bisphenolivorans]|uniref:hypothetical protein n=1 Tax=Sphingobium bisphenolivorans TaxID=1335760 RepID=UPI0003A09827|nr:hypothetical protein [Sphingobium bisphenolivorans]
MDRLEEAYAALAAHIDIHGKKGPYNGIEEIAADLGMNKVDMSDADDIHFAYRLNQTGAKLTLIYLLVPAPEGQPIEENYWLELSGRGPASHAKVWHFSDGELVDNEPIRKAA